MSASIKEKYAEELYNSTDTVACLDALREASEAVDIINKDMFSGLAKVCRNYILAIPVEDQYLDTFPLEEVKSMLNLFEGKYKRAKGIRTMPGSYRSAKSVIINAIKEEVQFVDRLGEPKTKVRVEREIRQARKGTGKKADTPNNVVYKARRELETLIAQTEDNQSTGLAENLSLIEDLCQHIREKYL